MIKSRTPFSSLAKAAAIIRAAAANLLSMCELSFWWVDELRANAGTIGSGELFCRELARTAVEGDIHHETMLIASPRLCPGGRRNGGRCRKARDGFTFQRTAGRQCRRSSKRNCSRSEHQRER